MKIIALLDLVPDSSTLDVMARTRNKYLTSSARWSRKRSNYSTRMASRCHRQHLAVIWQIDSQTSRNQWVQATAGAALGEFLATWPGAPDPVVLRKRNESSETLGHPD